jgi:sulfite exporter TauE/SafE
LPFIALSKARGWRFGKTLLWTVICGCGHVWSSVLLGLGGAALGWSLSKISWLQTIRGGVAGWVLLLFGLIYGAWGWRRAYQNKTHKHFDAVEDGSIYVYEHKHGEVVMPKERYKVTPWVMLLYFPAAKNNWWGISLLIFVYTFFTLITMLIMVILGYYGVSFLKTEKLERYVHALGGLTIFICGAGMVFLAW